ncbi:WecB/TagA/CpsF family glycosyltransferase [Mycobacterium hubeiense]|uniref:WecB/TagA/CpsF family glycosyltransferase n=1 Tax=Mycobacterium hubeiense TaxID=1867256 RepID=UPI000C7EF3B8|nr:WecB/TagA/CpsF family glycosyltransferase [Mycobacterium sp. QGD 101]
MRIGDVQVVSHTADQVLSHVVRRLEVPHPAPLAVGSVNLDHLHHFRPGRARIGSQPDWLWLADGAPVAFRGTRLVGRPWPRVTGADLLEPILDLAAARDARVGFFGGVPEMHTRLSRVLKMRHPQAPPARFWSPTREEVECAHSSAALADQIRAAGVQILVVGLGKPRQELWIQRHAAETGAAVLLAFGAAADFLAGVVERAPLFYQRHGLEWLYRLRKEPRRLVRRYLVQGPPALFRLRHATIEATVKSTSPVRPGQQP